MSSINQIANRMYGDVYGELSSGEKAAVTKAFNAQGSSSSSASGAGVKATIGRVGDNGTETCILETGATIADLLEQANVTLDAKKEKVVDIDTGFDVALDDEVKHNGTYGVAPEIDSAC